MRICLIHEQYRQPGGEDLSAAAEGALLESRGWEVQRYTVHNDEIGRYGRLALARCTLWNRRVYRDLRELLRSGRPQAAHFHNTFPLVSPAAYYAAREEGVPVVQTLRNFRLLCVNALLMRGGGACESCLGRAPWRGVLHRCYRNSLGASAAAAAMLIYHRWKRTYAEMVDVYVALTDFTRRKFIAGGLPAEKIVVKPNFVHPDPGPGAGAGGYAVFAGRLSAEKGVLTLLRAWERIGLKLPLKIAGDGPLAPAVQDAVGRSPGLAWLRQVSLEGVLRLLGDAAFLVLPSECYENMPRTIVEAFAKGTPVVASRLGAMAELVRHGESGRLFQPGDAEDLAAQAHWMVSHPSERARMRRAAREEYEAKYTAQRNYRMLMEVYRQASKAATKEWRQAPIECRRG